MNDRPDNTSARLLPHHAREEWRSGCVMNWATRASFFRLLGWPDPFVDLNPCCPRRAAQERAEPGRQDARRRRGNSPRVCLAGQNARILALTRTFACLTANRAALFSPARTHPVCRLPQPLPTALLFNCPLARTTTAIFETRTFAYQLSLTAKACQSPKNDNRRRLENLIFRASFRLNEPA